jgi:hypothetical protein
MVTTVFLNDDKSLRVSFAYSAEAVEAIKTVPGATWDKASKTWRVPVAKLDAVLRIFPDAAMAPEVACVAPAKLPIHHFAETCAAAGVTLQIVGDRVQGSGGCWTRILQAEIDKRATQLIRLIASGWQAPPPLEVAPAPVPETFDRITELDRVMARGEHRWREAAAREEGYKEAARRARFERAANQVRQASMFEQEGI